MQLSHKQKIFFNIFLHFFNLECILNIPKKKMTVTPDLFLNLRTLKNMVR